MAERKSNYDIHAEQARELFLGYDRNVIADKLGLEQDGGALYLNFYGERLRIDSDTGHVTHCSDGGEAEFNAVMSVYDLLCYSKPGARLSGRWRSLQNLSPHSNFGSKQSLMTPLAKKLTGRVPQLRELCQSLGGVPETTADAGYRFAAFDILPVIFQFWEGDDEFPPNLMILFDEATLDFIHFETAWYVAGFLIDKIEEAMNG